MTVTVRSFAKINLGLCVGALRADGFHDLRTVYQTIALHDLLQVEVGRGTGIEIRCDDPRVPKDHTNTCYRIVELAMAALRARGRVTITIDKQLPVQGGLGAGSGNAVATLLALERALKKKLPGAERLRLAAEVGSDSPLFLVGGTVLGVGHGEEVYPLPESPPVCCVVATPEIGVSTPKAFADWDAIVSAPPGRANNREGGERKGDDRGRDDGQRHDREGHDFSRASNASQDVAALAAEGTAEGGRPHVDLAKLTAHSPSDRMNGFGCAVSAWLSGQPLSGVPVSKGRGRAETSLLDLVRTGIENDFEQVVFPKYPELREVKGVLERAGAVYASLSGSGSAIYGLFASRTAGQKAAARLQRQGVPAVATTTMTREQYWQKFLVSGF
ncbi:MAG: 4-(cytidine 5'-diphospho)-2-C-methyl-D-erythritol kinase [Acidobacteriia bacterium]|nr:4-(cytidine 5'-diphospho)-2-C-methyl-D-erythritol kinase [Terriglobia bacterium]